ncbi:MAG: hypothetical protein R2702_15690 [Acidimicrobiales bacterium]
MRPARTSIALLALLALVLAGCAARGGTALDARNPAGTAPAPGAGGDPLFARAVAQTRDAGAFRFEVTGRAGIGDRQAATSMRGAIDPASGRASISGGIDGMGDGAQIEMVADGSGVYVRLGPLGRVLGVDTPWAHLVVDGIEAPVTELPDVLPARPDGLLDVLESIGAPAVEVERTELHGVAVRHLHAEVRVDELLDQLPEGDRAPLRDRLGEQGLDPSGLGGPLQVDVWLDDDDLVHQVRLRSTGPEVDGEASAVEVQLEILDQGQPVDIALPPADEVTDLDLADLLHR